jgi:hypothetical protein
MFGTRMNCTASVTYQLPTGRHTPAGYMSAKPAVSGFSRSLNDRACRSPRPTEGFRLSGLPRLNRSHATLTKLEAPDSGAFRVSELLVVTKPDLARKDTQVRPARIADNGSELARRRPDPLERCVEFRFETPDHARRLGDVPIAGPDQVEFSGLPDHDSIGQRRSASQSRLISDQARPTSELASASSRRSAMSAAVDGDVARCSWSMLSQTAPMSSRRSSMDRRVARSGLDRPCPHGRPGGRHP